MMRLRVLLVLCLFPFACFGLTVSNVIVARSVDQNSCSTPKSSASFDLSDREAFAWFRAQHLNVGDEVKLEWIAPGGGVALDAVYRDLPSSPSLCFASRLPIAGFNYVTQTGSWKVRVTAGDRTLAERDFRVTGETLGLRVTSIRRSNTESGIELTVDGAGFGADAMVHIAQYTATGGWRYLSSAQQRAATTTEL